MASFGIYLKFLGGNDMAHHVSYVFICVVQASLKWKNPSKWISSWNALRRSYRHSGRDSAGFLTAHRFTRPKHHYLQQQKSSLHRLGGSPKLCLFFFLGKQNKLMEIPSNHRLFWRLRTNQGTVPIVVSMVERNAHPMRRQSTVVTLKSAKTVGIAGKDGTH